MKRFAIIKREKEGKLIAYHLRITLVMGRAILALTFCPRGSWEVADRRMIAGAYAHSKCKFLHLHAGLLFFKVTLSFYRKEREEQP